MFSPFDIDNLLVEALLRIVAAVIVLLLGRWLAGLAKRYVERGLVHTHMTPSLEQLFARTTYYLILLVAILTALVTLGVSATTLLTAVGIVVIITAIALRETLRDLATTILFFIFQPFRAGDLIETQGVIGHVQEIQMFSSVIITLDRRKQILPNGSIQSGPLINYSALNPMRIDLSCMLSYRDDLALAREILLAIAAKDARVLRDPPPRLVVQDLDERGMHLVLRAFVSRKNIGMCDRRCWKKSNSRSTATD